MPSTPCQVRVTAPGEAEGGAGAGLEWNWEHLGVGAPRGMGSLGVGHPMGGCWCLCCLQPWAQPLSLLSPVQYEVSGEEHLYSDFPEIDLSQLDAGDLDSAGCFSELHWGSGEHSETDSSQYSTDDSELFQVPPPPQHGGRGSRSRRVGGGNTHNY